MSDDNKEKLKRSGLFSDKYLDLFSEDIDAFNESQKEEQQQIKDEIKSLELNDSFTKSLVTRLNVSSI